MKKLLLLFLMLPVLSYSQALSGSYTITTLNTDPNFKTLAAAITRINTVGVSGPVTFLLDENQTVTSQITINQFTGTSATNTLTIKPNVSKDITISGKISEGAVIALNRADNVIIDGNNSASDNKLKIYNNFDEKNSDNSRLGIMLHGEAENNKLQNFTVQLNILGITIGTYSVGIYSGGNSISKSGNNSNNSILDITFIDVKQAIFINGLNTSNKNWLIQNNKIGSSDDNSKPFVGIYIKNISDYEVSNNIINGVRLPNNLGGNITYHSGIFLDEANNGVISNNTVSNVKNSRGTYLGYGIYIKGDDNQVSQNSIKNLDSNSSNDGSYGIRVEGSNTTIYKNDIANIFSSEAKNTNGIYISGDNQLVYNNFINDVKSAGGGGTDSQNGFGIYINNGSDIKLYYNTVVLKTNQNAGVSAALYIKGGSKLDVRNNIFYNAQTSTSYRRFAIYSEVTNATSFDFLDYNDYYSTQDVGSWGNYYTPSNRRTTIANWRTATGKDLNSINVSPAFVSATDLHLQNVVGNDVLKAGISITGITTDIDDETRAISPDKPYMGADERCKLPNPAGTITGTPAVCQGQTNVSYTVPAIVNATTYVWSYSGLGATIINSSTRTPTITFDANATSGDLTVKGKNNCGEGTISTIYKITINTLPSKPKATNTNATCASATGSITITSPTPADGISFTVTGTNPFVAPQTNVTGVFSGLVVGTYNVTAMNASGCVSQYSDDVIIKPLVLVTNTWNGTVWSTGSKPSSDAEEIIFNGDYQTRSEDLTACTCLVKAGKKVIIKEGKTLKLTKGVMVEDAVNPKATLTFENNASLVQVNDDAVNAGVISYIRINSTTRETDYTYWSSPVAGQKLIDVSPNTPSDFFYSFNAVEDNWNYAVPSTVMGVGTGYIIRGPKIVGTPPLKFHEATFKGTPNNGKIELSGVIKDRSYLLGNPYPSALNAYKFITDNSDVLDGTLYFWTHITPIGDAVFNPGSGVYAYSSNDYATYNLSGGVATNPGSATSQNVSDKPTGRIAAGQAFFTSSKLEPAKNIILFNNRMRLDLNDAILDNSQFFKVKNSTKKTYTIEKHRIWLNLTNTEGAFKQMLVGYITGATNDYDPSFDGPSYNGNEFIDFYSVTPDELLTIQGRALPFDENDSVPLGYSSAIEGNFSISIDEVDGLLVGQNIYLEDKLNNSIHNLTKEPYTFETTKGTFDDRFVLRYTDKTLGVADLDQLEDQVIISKDKNELKIKSANETIKRVTIFDLLGKKVFDKEALDETEFRSSNVSLFKQIGIVKVTLATGQVISKKVAF